MQYAQLLIKNLRTSAEAKISFIEQQKQIAEFQRATEIVVERYRRGGRLYIAGNGGSAADAQHLAAEFVSKLTKDRAPLPAEALTVDSSILTAIGNDYGFEEVFSRQLRGKLTANDVFLGITTSGESPNILSALRTCRELQVPTIVFSGRKGGTALELADHCIIASGDGTATIQELHIVLAHTLCECVENVLLTDTK